MIVLLLLSACEHEVLISEGGEEIVPEEKVQIELFTRVNSYGLPATKALGDEDTVGKTPWVLVFRGNNSGATFVEAVQAFELVGKRYVLLTPQNDGSKYQLLILANTQDKFYYGDVVTGYDFNETTLSDKLISGTTTLSDACKMLRTKPLSASLDAIPFSAAGAAIPMSYLLTVDKIDNTTKIANNDNSSLQLTRTVAKVIIVNKAPTLTFNGIYAVGNVPRQGQLHNLGGSIMNSDSILTKYGNNAAFSSALITTEVVSGGQSTESKPIYLYESGARNNMYIIIKGKFEGKDYYYKVGIIDDDEQYIDVVRNHAYTFTINTAAGPGYDTVADAMASKASNTGLDVRMTVDESDAYEIMANNDYYMAVSNSVYLRYTNEFESSEAFKVITDCQTVFTSSGNNVTDNRSEVGWQLAELSPEAIPIVGSSTTNPRVTPVRIKVGTYLLWEESTVWGKKDAYITLKLGNLEKKINVRQRNAIPAAGVQLSYRPDGSVDPTSYELRYYCHSAYVEGGSTWIKLHSSAGGERDVTDSITVDDGIILVEVTPNTSSSSRNAIIYLTTIKDPDYYSVNTMQRIKIDLTQLGV